jgi:MFS transporter, ACS family, tartrate transporter
VWLSRDERDWISAEIEVEIQAKNRARDYTVWQAFRNKHVLWLIVPYFLALMGAQANVFWIPTFIHRWSGLSGPGGGVVGGTSRTRANCGHAAERLALRQNGERRWHTAIPLILRGWPI